MPKRTREYHDAGSPVSRNIITHLWESVALDLKIIFLWILLTAVTRIIPVLASSPVRFVFAIPFLIFIPGYCITAALYPDNKSMGNIKRLLISVGLSIALVLVAALVLTLSSSEIQLNPIIVFLGIISFVTGLVTQYRCSKLPEEDCVRLSFLKPKDQSDGEDLSPEKRPNHRTVYAILIVIFLIAAIFIAAVFLMGTPKNRIDSTSSLNNGSITKLNITLVETSIPVQNTNAPTVTQIPVSIGSSDTNQYGQLNVSIGNYNANLPVMADGIVAGNVTSGNQLNLTLSEGHHTIRVCSGTFCEQVNVYTGSSIKTTIDFEELLKRDAPQGFLSVSAGNYSSTLPVYIDNTFVGTVSQGKMLNQSILTGNHTVGVCVLTTCLQENVSIKPANLTFLDFGVRLKNNLPQGSLSVSIGGYNAERLPVFIDNTTIGNVSIGRPLDVRVNEGNHTVSVCVGKICENESVQIIFAKQTALDFGERLKKDVEFPSPAVRILQSSSSGSTMTVNVEFINPDSTDHSFTATISCVYSFTDSQDMRKSDSAQTRVIKTIKAGTRVTQQFSLSLSGGSNIIANDPVVRDVIIN